MGAVVAGSRELLSRYPRFLLLVDPTSPLVHSREAIEKLLFMAKNKLPVIYAPGIMAGATSPVTMAGAIAQANAEILAGLVIHQLTTPGAPFVYGGGMSPMDMKSGQPTYSAPEAMMAQAGLCQMSRDFYHLPTWGFGGCSASKQCDAQAVNEAATYNLTAAWAGTNLVHDLGYIEFGITYSLELLVLCNEFIGQVRRMMDGIVVDDEHLALDAVDRVGPGNSFLTDPHTFSHFKNNWQPDLTDRRIRKNWKKSGSLSMEKSAKERIRSILDTHIPAPMEDKIENKINSIIQSAKIR
ncbi:MAG: trimethylamine methyltransferase, partial [Desulfobacteraceae bacterium]|nr:trimethylamine methyltransferase [Desulfobacteraceae bacterium]